MDSLWHWLPVALQALVALLLCVSAWYLHRASKAADEALYWLREAQRLREERRRLESGGG